MTRNTKIFLGFLALLLVIFLFYRNSKTGIEKSLIKNEVAKATREPILGKEPKAEILSKVFKAEIPFVNNKQIQHKYDENKTISSKTLVVKWEEVEDPKMDDIKEISEIYPEFIEKYSDARYFKTDFTELFKKKVGDEVTLVIDNEEFEGFIIKSKSVFPKEEYYKDGSVREIFNSIRIQPSSDDYSNYITVSGHLNPINGDYSYEGDINYIGINGGLKYRYNITNKVGVILPYHLFNNYMFNDLGFKLN